MLAGWLRGVWRMEDLLSGVRDTFVGLGVGTGNVSSVGLTIAEVSGAVVSDLVLVGGLYC